MSLPQSEKHLDDDTAIYCNPGTAFTLCVCACVRTCICIQHVRDSAWFSCVGNMSPEIPDMSSQSTGLVHPFSPRSPPQLSSTPAAFAPASGSLFQTPSAPPPATPPASNPPPLLKVERSNGISRRSPLPSHSPPLTLSQLPDAASQPSLLLSNAGDVFPECLLCGLQVLLGLLGEPGTTIEGSVVALDTGEWSHVACSVGMCCPVMPRTVATCLLCVVMRQGLL